MNQSIRINAIQVIVNQDLTINYRLTLPVKEQHIHLMPSERVRRVIKDNKPRYYYIQESSERTEILKHLVAAQLVITEQKIKELQSREESLLIKLSTI